MNLDEIARGFSPLDPEKVRQRAARAALDVTSDFIAKRVSFSIETTLAGRTHLRTLDAAQRNGFKIVLLFFSLATVDICLSRIARRVSEGGHNVPEVDVRRRFDRSAANLPGYATRASVWRVFDVSSMRVRVAAEGRSDCVASDTPDAVIAPAVCGWIKKLPPCKEQ